MKAVPTVPRQTALSGKLGSEWMPAPLSVRPHSELTDCPQPLHRSPDCSVNSPKPFSAIDVRLMI